MNLKELLQARFEHHPKRHSTIVWNEVLNHLDEPMWNTIKYMEESGGEPDLIDYQGQWLMVDMSKESPGGRRNCCYDMQARVNRKKFPPESSALEDAFMHQLTLVDEALYLFINKIESLDLKTSSWLLTPDIIRSKGGALTGDTRFGRTFIYHNGADSYYGVRAYRGYFKVK